MSYTFDDNGNLLATGSMTNAWDAANRLTAVSSQPSAVSFSYDGEGNRVGRVSNGITTTFALDVQGLPEVIYTSPSTGSGQVGNAYLHLPGVIVAENTVGERRYLLSDGLGSIRQAIDETGAVVAYNEFDPYGNPAQNGDEVYGFTGEWWENEIGLLYLRARWYAPETGTFLNVDPVESEPPYAYVRGNPVNSVDPSGLQSPSNSCQRCDFWANGYAEGTSGTFTVNGLIVETNGREAVYDFATMERTTFTFTKDFSYNPSGVNIPGAIVASDAFYFSTLHNFRSKYDVNTDYKGHSDGISVSIGVGLGLGVSAGYTHVWGAKHSENNLKGVTGDGLFVSVDAGYSYSPFPFVGGNVSWMATLYTQKGKTYEYASIIGGKYKVTRNDVAMMRRDINTGSGAMDYPVVRKVGAYQWREWALADLERIWSEHSDYFLYQYDDCRKKHALLRTLAPNLPIYWDLLNRSVQ